jgi:hypothetical protein
MKRVFGDFIEQFRKDTEARWRAASINPHIYEFQIQPGTKWNPGLNDPEIAAYENALSARFPHDFRTFLRAMNGTDLPTLNVYGYCGEPHRESVGVYSYPRDLERIKSLIEMGREGWDVLITTMADQGFSLDEAASLVPIYAHRYVVCTSDLDSSVVLSIADAEDAIVYGSSLQEYLEREFLG